MRDFCCGAIGRKLHRATPTARATYHIPDGARKPIALNFCAANYFCPILKKICKSIDRYFQ
ncbi:MAG: hypothetical protein HC849_20020 [Oscillatoriales cyanobacterium RU_3_3]|nr:hypothetical protein [Oscillatoriales cyanobacterium RU_3_3]